MTDIDSITPGQTAELIRISSCIAGLRRRIKYFDQSLAVRNSIPESIDETIKDGDFEEEMGKMAVISAILSKSYLMKMRSETREVLEYLEGIFGLRVSDWETINGDDIEAIGALFRILGKLRERSRNQFKQFLRCSSSGESGWVLMHSGRKGIESRFKYEVPDEVKRWFEAEMGNLSD